MIGVAGVLISAVKAASRIRRMVATARQVAGAAVAAKQNLMGIADEIRQAREGAMSEISKALKSAGPTEQCALIHCRAEVCKAAATALAEVECHEEDLKCEAALGNVSFAPPEPEKMHPFIEPGVQNTFPHEGLRRWGCYFFCLVRWAEWIRGRGFGIARIMELYEALVRAGHIRDDNIVDRTTPAAPDKFTAFIISPAAVLNGLLGREEFTRATEPDTRPQGTCVEAVRHGLFRHFTLHLEDGTFWDSLGGSGGSYINDGWREIT